MADDKGLLFFSEKDQMNADMLLDVKDEFPKIEDFSSSSLNSNAELHHLYQMLQQEQVQVGTTNHIDQQQFSGAHFTPSYRENTAIDDATSMPFTGGMHLHHDMAMMADDSTLCAGAAEVPSLQKVRPDSEYGNVTVTGLLCQSDRMHITDDPFLDQCTYDSHSFESPRKMSRANNDTSVNVDKLFGETNESHTPADSFRFQKFGAELNRECSRSGMDSGMLSSQSFMTHTRSPAQQPMKQMHEMQCSHPAEHLVASSMNEQCIAAPQMIAATPTMAAPPVMDNMGHQHLLIASEPYSSKTARFTTNHSQKMSRRNLLNRMPPLTQSFPDRHGSIVLKILNQPETQHRARYMTEGSRGAVKDDAQQGHPVVQLVGWNQEARLEVFIGTDSGKIRPHAFYQACRVCSKNSTPCKEREMDGTVLIEYDLDPGKSMTTVIDSVGILKLRNTDVEKRIGILKTKKSTKCRLVFRVSLLQAGGSLLTLQTVSNVICCTQPAGQPEICRMSLTSASIKGGQELFVIGKNFVKGFTVKFQEVENGTEDVIWEANANIDAEYIQTTHFICTVPPYKMDYICGPVNVRVVVSASGGVSDPSSFQYLPLCKEGSTSFSGTTTTSSSSEHSSSQETLELVDRLQTSGSNSALYQLADHSLDFNSSEDPSRNLLGQRTNGNEYLGNNNPAFLGELLSSPDMGSLQDSAQYSSMGSQYSPSTDSFGSHPS